MDLITFYHTVTAVFFGAVGLCVGSFLNVVIYRLPNHMSLASPPSHCTQCGYQLRWFDNIPVFSYLFLRGKCRKCRSKISPRYLFVELANMILWLLCLSRFGFSGWREGIMTVSSALACSVCICISAIDLEHKIIYDRFQLIMMALAIAFVMADVNSSILSNILSAVVSFFVLLLISTLVAKRVGREALGGGDIKFTFVSALFLGWKRLILLWILACVSFLIFMAVTGMRKRKPAGEDEPASHAEYAFGPFLAFGFIVALLFGIKIISAYFGLFGIKF